jgi:hypothetical protein
MQRDIEWQAIECTEYLFSRSREVVSNFWVTVQRASQRDSIFLKSLGLATKFGAVTMLFNQLS